MNDMSEDLPEITEEESREAATKGMINEFDRRGANMPAQIVRDYFAAHETATPEELAEIIIDPIDTSLAKLSSESKDKIGALLTKRISQLDLTTSKWERDRLVSMLGVL